MKKDGFSIVELLIAFSIVAIITAITVPQFSSFRSVNAFRNEAQSVLDMVISARNNAISEKQCRDEEILDSWNMRIDQSAKKYVLFCKTTASDEETIAEEADLPDHAEIELIEFPDKSTETSVILTFAPQITFSRIGETGTHKEVRILLVHPLSQEKKTLCYNSISSFPILRSDDIDTPCQ